jgi:hypothetical protein
MVALVTKLALDGPIRKRKRARKRFAALNCGIQPEPRVDRTLRNPMGITFGDHLIGHHDITHEQEREIEARKECTRRGLDPDDDAADGIAVWQVVDKELQENRPNVGLGWVRTQFPELF